MGPDMTHILELTAIASVQGHKEKYVHNECTDKKPQQKNRNWKKEPNENLVIKCNTWNKKIH